MASFINIGNISASSLATNVLFSSTVSEPSYGSSSVVNLEKSIFKNLVKSDPIALGNDELPNLVSQNLDVDLEFKRHVQISNELNDSNVLMTLQFIEDTDVANGASEYDEKQNNASGIAGQQNNSVVELGNDTAPLYVGHIRFDYSDGDTVSSDVNGHHISFDTTDIDYNRHKAMNSTLSNLDPAAINGIQGEFDNNFNNTHAFYTETIIERAFNNVLEPSENTLGVDGINYNNSLSQRDTLGVNILSSTTDNHPLFGSLKFVQDDLEIDVESNLVVDSTLSTLSVNTNTAVGDQTTHTTLPVTIITEEDFENLFTPEDFTKIGPGYKLSINVGDNELGGYAIVDQQNIIYDVNYDDSNVGANSSSEQEMFTLDDSNILENIHYMKLMKDNELFGEHQLYVQNGNLVKNPFQTTNANFDRFVIRDGVEKLEVTSGPAINDLNADGLIAVIDTNNILDDINARYAKTSTSDDNNVIRLLVNYIETESSYISEVGVLNESFKEIYNVISEVSVLAKSTITSDQLWTAAEDVKMNDDSVLVFQSAPNSLLYDKSNVESYNATGLQAFVQPGEFALLQVKKTMNLEDSNESPMFKTSDNEELGVLTNVSITNMDLNLISADDLRITIDCKTPLDLPELTQTTTTWSWHTGNSTDGNLNITDGNVTDANNSFLLSVKDGSEYLGTKTYDVMKSGPNSSMTITFKLLTSDIPLESKDILERRVEVFMLMDEIVDKKIDVEIDDNDLEFIDTIDEFTTMVETIGQEQLVNYQLSSGGNVPTHYEVRKKTTVKTYKVAIRNKVGPYKNLWVVSSPITETTTWFELYNTRKQTVMPDYYLKQIVDSDSVQVFKSYRYFNEENTHSLETTTLFQVKDMMGFTCNVQYYDGTYWQDFDLTNDYSNSVDPMYDLPNIFGLVAENSYGTINGTLRLTLDTPMFTRLGVDGHSVSNQNPMYMINISNAIGENQFIVTGYKYDVANDAQYFNKTDLDWSPYNVDTLFLTNEDGHNMGVAIPNLVAEVQLIDPTPDNQDDVNEVNKVKVIVKSNDNELFSFVSNKYILENFNIICNKETIIQHDYQYGRVAPLTQGVEYIQCKDHYDDTFYAKLTYGTMLMNGVRVDINRISERHNNAMFELKGDRVYMSPLVNGVQNPYTGRYSVITGTEILPSSTGYPLPTNSLIHRNIHPTVFRGLINSQSNIVLLRTITRVKLVIGNKFVDDMNVPTNSNISYVWANRHLLDGEDITLNALDIYQATTSFTTVELDNMNLIPGQPANSSGSIGRLGLKITPNFSMFPSSVSNTVHKIPIQVTPANYTKTIINPLETSMEETIISDVFDVVLHQYVPYSLVATRVKLYTQENYSLEYIIPDLKVYHSPTYVGDVRTNVDWTTEPIQTFSDPQLRDTVVIGDSIYSGVVEFTRNLINVTSHVKYAILPRPIAKLSAYNINDIQNIVLPSNLSSYNRNLWGVDIDITIQPNGQGLAPTSQNHKPFNKYPTQLVPNQLNAVEAGDGLNNLTLGLNIAKYLHLREETQPSFSFSIGSNRLTLTNDVCLSSTTRSPTELFNGYISQLGNLDNWIVDNYDDTQLISNNFTTNKKWNLNFRQLLSAISQYITLPPNASTDQNIFVNGITSFGMGTYYLDLTLLDSVIARYYMVNPELTNDNKHKLTLHRYSTAQGISWENDTVGDGFIKSYAFKPTLFTHDTTSVELDIPNELTDEPFDVINKLHSVIDVTTLPTTWTNDTTFSSVPCPIRILPLSTLGSGSLREVLHVTKDTPLKVFASLRPPLLSFRSADNGTLLTINHDGKLFSNSVVSKQLQLSPDTSSSSGFSPSIANELWSGNIVPSNTLTSEPT